MTFHPAHYRVLSCASLVRAVYEAAATSQAVISVEVMEQGLHDRPARLRAELQTRIDSEGQDDVDAVLLAYGLCGGATRGLLAGSVPLVMARAHDCITLQLGSRERYDREFTSCPGTYWMSRDFLERNRRGDVATLGVSAAGYQDLIDRFGPENAAYLAEAMQGWATHYHRLVYIEGESSEPADYRADAEEKARLWGLAMEARPSDHRLIEALLAGRWGDEFLVIPPGGRIALGNEEQIVTNEKESAK